MLYTANQVSEKLNLSIHTIRKWIQIKKIRVVKLGKSVRISQEELDRLMKGE